MKEILTKHLLEKYNPIAIVLHGSRANGNAREHSDWDFLMFTNQQIETHREIFQDQNLEVIQVVLPVSEEKIKKTFGFYFRKENTEIVYDPKNIIPALIEKNEEILGVGNLFNDAEIIARFSFMSSTLDGIEDYSNNALIVFSKKAEFYDRSVSGWFKFLHHEFKPSDYYALPRIEKEDPEFFYLLNKFINADANNARIIGGKLLESLFPVAYKKLWKRT